MIGKEFTKIPVDINIGVKQPCQSDTICAPAQKFSSTKITYRRNDTMASLPYADVYTEKYLRDRGLKRLEDTKILARGDSRSPELIKDTGGFQPTCSLNKNPPKDEFDEDIFNVHFHRSQFGQGEPSALISTTTDFEVAKTFGAGFIYVLRNRGGIKDDKNNGDQTIFQVFGSYTKEKEVTTVGGIDWDDVIAYRSIFHGQEIYIRTSTIEEQGENFLKDMISFLLYPDESATLPNVVNAAKDPCRTTTTSLASSPHTSWNSKSKRPDATETVTTGEVLGKTPS